MNAWFYICIGLLLIIVILIIRPVKKEKQSFGPACPVCGHRHPLVAEFGYCGKCASEIYGDYP